MSLLRANDILKPFLKVNWFKSSGCQAADCLIAPWLESKLMVTPLSSHHTVHTIMVGNPAILMVGGQQQLWQAGQSIQDQIEDPWMMMAPPSQLWEPEAQSTPTGSLPHLHPITHSHLVLFEVISISKVFPGWFQALRPNQFPYSWSSLAARFTFSRGRKDRRDSRAIYSHVQCMP